MTDDLTTFAKRYRQEAAAALLSVIRDDTAVASARIAAASKVLEYSDGRPGQAKPITITDLQHLTGDQKRQLFMALVQHYHEEIGLDQLISAAVDEALAREAQRKIGFTRGPRALPPPSTTLPCPTRACTSDKGQGGGHSSGHPFPHSGERPRASPGDPATLRNVADLARTTAETAAVSQEANDYRSERLAVLAAEMTLPRYRNVPLHPGPTPTLACDSAAPYQHALRLSRMSRPS